MLFILHPYIYVCDNLPRAGPTLPQSALIGYIRYNNSSLPYVRQEQSLSTTKKLPASGCLVHPFHSGSIVYCKSHNLHAGD